MPLALDSPLKVLVAQMVLTVLLVVVTKVTVVVMMVRERRTRLPQVISDLGMLRLSSGIACAHSCCSFGGVGRGAPNNASS